MAANKTNPTRGSSGAGITEAEKTDPGVAWEATETLGVEETQNQLLIQWVSILMAGVAVCGYFYL